MTSHLWSLTLSLSLSLWLCCMCLSSKWKALRSAFICRLSVEAQDVKGCVMVVCFKNLWTDLNTCRLESKVHRLEVNILAFESDHPIKLPFSLYFREESYKTFRLEIKHVLYHFYWIEWILPTVGWIFRPFFVPLFSIFHWFVKFCKSRDSSVGIATRLRAGRSGF
jgi:hypothetical protein